MAGHATVRGRIVTPAGVVDDGYLHIEGDRIVAVGHVATHAQPSELPPPAGTILPGLIDLHCHGGGGSSVASGVFDETVAVAEHHRTYGTISMLLSTVTDSPERMLAAVSAAAAASLAGAAEGVHIEGPFLSPSRCGAQDPTYLRAPDAGFTRELLAAGDGQVRTMTFAPELVGAGQLADQLAENRVIGAVGHTAGDAETVSRALNRPGTDIVTHVFNGMPPLHHRSPGPVAAALTSAARRDAWLELVADGVHVADATIKMMFDLVGPERLLLVSDAMAAAGMPDGAYALGPQTVTVSGGVARLQEGTEPSIAGSTARLLDVVRRCVLSAHVALADAVASASSSPAAVLGLTGEIGALVAGARANLVVTDAELHPLRVMHTGNWLPS